MISDNHIILMLDNSRAADRGMIRGIMDYAHLRGNWHFYRYSPRFRVAPFTPGGQDDILERLHRLEADGIIGYLPDEAKLIQLIQHRGFPAVTIPVRKPIQGLVSIQQDESVGIVGARHLLERGYRHFAYCGMKDYWSTVRQQGFCDELERHGCGAHIYPLARERKRRELELNRMARWIVELDKPVAIMACNDERSADLVEACRLADCAIPDLVALLGVDNDEMICRLTSPQLSSVKLNFEKVGYEAARALDHQIGNKERLGDEIRFVSTGVVTRQSTNILAFEDAEVASALQFIRNNARRNIRVQDVVDHSLLSLRALQQRFRGSLGRSIHQEIRRVRIDLFAQMLVNTDLTVYQIAGELELEDTHHIARLFKREMGLTPVEYRKLNRNP